jgi:hypothetical protein
MRSPLKTVNDLNSLVRGSAPIDKVKYPGMAGMAITLVLAIAKSQKIELSGDEAAAIVTVVMFIVGYFSKLRRSEIKSVALDYAPLSTDSLPPEK